MVVAVGARRVGEVTNACRSYDGPVSRKTRALTPAEVGQLSALLRQADLFGRVSAGSDHRGIDLPLITLTADVDGRSAMWSAFEILTSRKRVLGSAYLTG